MLLATVQFMRSFSAATSTGSCIVQYTRVQIRHTRTSKRTLPHAHTRAHTCVHTRTKKKKKGNKNKHTQKAKWSFHCVSKVSVSPFCNHVKCPVGLIRFDRPFCNHISPKLCRKAKGKGKETMCEGGSAGRWGSVQTKQNRTKYFSKCYNTDGEQVIPSRGTILSLFRSRFGSHSGLGSSNKCPKKCVWPPL